MALLFFIEPKRYRWFITYLAASLLGTFYLLSVPVRSARYTEAWIIVQFATLLLLYAAALEIYTALAGHFGGVDGRGKIVSYLRRVLNALMALSLAVCIAFAIFDARGLDKQFFSLASALTTTVLLKRIATSTLAMFLAASALYFSRFRVTLRSNLRVHGLLFTIWMIVSSVALFWRNVDARSAYQINAMFLAASIVIFGIWTIWLKKAGESVPMGLSISEGGAEGDRQILLAFLKKLTRQR